jgi:tRNA (guanine-N7-)-methyltransferase
MLLKLADHDIPSTAERLFGRAGPLVLEVGFGDGQFTAWLASEHPAWNVLGAEVSLASVTRAVKRMRREGVRNVLLYRGPARFLVYNLSPPRHLHHVYVNFPDPWPRPRHHKNRLLQADFFRLLASRLTDGGALQLTTDHEEYYRLALSEAAATGCYAVTEAPPPAAALRTKYARKWQAQQRSFYHARFEKTGEDGSFEPAIEKVPMQHALLEGDLAGIGPFRKQTIQYPGGHVVLLDAYRALDEDRLVFQALTNEEGDLRQEFLIEARPRDQGGILVSMLRFGDPLSTRGGREAVRAVARWLEGQGLRMVEHWY